MVDIHPDVRKHVNDFEEVIRHRFLSIRHMIVNTIPNVEEKLGYGVPGYYVDGKNILYVACFKNHIGIYPGSAFILKHEVLLKPYKTSKGTIHFKHTEPIPFDVIERILADKGFGK